MNFNKLEDRSADDSVDSFEEEIRRVNKDFEEKVLDKELMVDKRGGNQNDSNRQMSKESDDEDQSVSGITSNDKDGKKNNDEESDEEYQLESNISKALSDKITKVVVVLVLIMLFLLPVLDYSQFLDH